MHGGCSKSIEMSVFAKIRLGDAAIERMGAGDVCQDQGKTDEPKEMCDAAGQRPVDTRLHEAPVTEHYTAMMLGPLTIRTAGASAVAAWGENNLLLNNGTLATAGWLQRIHNVGFKTKASRTARVPIPYSAAETVL